MDSYSVGIMSGTGMDGIDAVLARFVDHRFAGVVAAVARPFEPRLRRDLLALQDTGTDELRRARLLATELSRRYAEAVRELLAAPEARALPVEVVACHGQTVRHAPRDGYSIQLCDGALLAELTGLPVACDFRAGDIAAGGEGAPLVPAFHDMVFGQPGKTVVVANIGGIANITVLSENLPVFGFDTGPGNMLIDAWMRDRFRLPYDRDGAVAASGKVLPELLRALAADDWFARKPPKSTGRDLFSPSWLRARLRGDEQDEDVAATLVELTASSLAAAVSEYAPGAERLILCGGGSLNGFLRRRLTAALPDSVVEDSAAYDLPVTQVEAAAFAWLGHARLHGMTGNLPAVTGARAPRVLGALWSAPAQKSD